MKLDYVCSRCGTDVGFGKAASHLPGGVMVEWCSACLTAWAAYAMESQEWLVYMAARSNLQHYEAGGSSDTSTQELVISYRDAEVAMAGLATTFEALS